MALPLACYTWALWCWGHRDRSSIPSWRRSSTRLSVVLAGVTLALAAFVFIDMYHYSVAQFAPSKAAIASVEAGVLLGLLGMLLSVFARSWTRIAIFFSCASLLWVCFLIILSP